MKQLFFCSVFAVLLWGCSQKQEQPQPPQQSASSASAPALPPPSPSTPTVDDDESDDGSMTSGLAGAAAGGAAATATTATKAAAMIELTPEQSAAERLTRQYVAATKNGRSYAKEIALLKVAKGPGERCWWFTYRIGNVEEITIQNKDNIATVVGTPKSLK
ncbi:MAG: hypothetical protein JSS75_03000 [Bacteroidetes bacterium]|nr:hypothetical protein [Bacteroidota bacterium]